MANEDIIGKRFGKLVVVELTNKQDKGGSFLYKCICDCGNEYYTRKSDLLRKKWSTKSCGCSRYVKGKWHHLFGKYHSHNTIPDTYWNKLKYKAINKRNIKWNITVEQAWDLFVKQDKKCALSGVDLKFSANLLKSTASLDRIDRKVGYQIDNVQWVHKDVNQMKHIYSDEHFITWCGIISEFNRNQDKSSSHKTKKVGLIFPELSDVEREIIFRRTFGLEMND